MKTGDTISKCVGPHPTALYGFRPGCKEKILRAGQSSEMSYNKLGLRDKDFSAKPKAGWKRILFIGSSAMAAPGISESQAPPKRLEAVLRKQNKKIEVINAGVEGYTNLQLAAIAPALIKEYSPTHVVMYVSIGQSVNIDMMNEPYVSWTAEGRLTLSQQIFPLSQRYADFNGWNLGEYMNRRRVLTIQSSWNRAIRTIKCVLLHREGLARSGCLMASSIRSVLLIHAQAEEAGARFLFLSDPNSSSNDMNVSPGHDFEIATRFDRGTPRVRLASMDAVELLRSNGVQVEVVQPNRRASMTLPGDYHFNAAGAEQFAEYLAPKVAKFLGM